MPAGEYSQKAGRYEQLRDDAARRSSRLSTYRLATFLPAAAVIVWMLSRGFSVAPSIAAAALFSGFGVLVVRQARVEERIAWLDALRIVNLRWRARIHREWPALPEVDTPAGIDLTHHPYAIDLDLFGHASLYQWFGPAATPFGARALAFWLLEPAPPGEISARQRAIAELSGAADWREQLAAHGILAGAAGRAEIDALLAWAEGDDPLGPNAAAIRALVYVITIGIAVLAALHAIGIITVALWLIPVLIGVILSFLLVKPVTTAFDRAGGGQRALRRYASLFAHAEALPRSAARLQGIHDRLSAERRIASDCMRQLNRILGFADLRRGAAIFHFIIQAVTLWDFHVLFALERWRRNTGRHVRAWFDALGEVDALAVFAGVKRDHPGWCTPEIVSEPALAARALGHPLLTEERRVPNDVTVGPPRTLLLITGSNMSGKSTLLRAIGLNAVLAQAGAAVCATSFRMPPSDLQTSIRVQDSLELGLSYFMAALARLKGVVDAAEHEREGRVLLYLLDEILQGTNSAERAIAVRSVARHLLDAGAIGAMTTHDLTLASEAPLNTTATLVHFTEIVDSDGVMRFDYRLRPGLATSRNALRLMKMIGINP